VILLRISLTSVHLFQSYTSNAQAYRMCKHRCAPGRPGLPAKMFCCCKLLAECPCAEAFQARPACWNRCKLRYYQKRDYNYIYRTLRYRQNAIKMEAKQ